mmetsp:Transcript_58661/g.85995  ORF Transcript_58661/g.85995 Transcript_58661/m.85995 type:complete len:205 (+) Transcript_58661:113-727(+)
MTCRATYCSRWTVPPRKDGCSQIGSLKTQKFARKCFTPAHARPSRRSLAQLQSLLRSLRWSAMKLLSKRTKLLWWKMRLRSCRSCPKLNARSSTQQTPTWTQVSQQRHLTCTVSKSRSLRKHARRLPHSRATPPFPMSSCVLSKTLRKKLSWIKKRLLLRGLQPTKALFVTRRNRVFRCMCRLARGRTLKMSWYFVYIALRTHR